MAVKHTVTTVIVDFRMSKRRRCQGEQRGGSLSGFRNRLHFSAYSFGLSCSSNLAY